MERGRRELGRDRHRRLRLSFEARLQHGLGTTTALMLRNTGDWSEEESGGNGSLAAAQRWHELGFTAAEAAAAMMLLC
ncbi:hypothetical protein M0R45_019781 [Rubus argutus]|uniref:Uncharacterized protein n=1 Tax=Rubus argutus TaxID=59490 RepID=A0AAW1X799_RUBAR